MGPECGAQTPAHTIPLHGPAQLLSRHRRDPGCAVGVREGFREDAGGVAAVALGEQLPDPFPPAQAHRFGKRFHTTPLSGTSLSRFAGYAKNLLKLWS